MNAAILVKQRPIAFSGLKRCAPTLQNTKITFPSLMTGRASGRVVIVKAGKDFDTILAETANQWEAAPNKVAIAGWMTGAISAIFVAEWLIHLPGLNVLLGFPVQFLGLMTVPYLYIRYYVDKKSSAFQDFEILVEKVSKQLPGLDK